MVSFREVQPARQWWLTLVLLVPLVITLWGLYQQLVLGRAWGNRPVSNTAFLLIEAGVVALFIWIHLIRLVTEVRHDALVIRYIGLWPSRRITYADIASARDITYSPILNYGGWGVRRGWDGSTVYSAKGDRGVEVILRNGKRIIIGSQRSAELASAIAARIPS